GLTVVYPETVDQLLETTPIEDLCGIGGRLKTALNNHGIKTCKQMGEKDEGYLQYYWGFWGHWMKRMGQGLGDTPVAKTIDQQPPAKSVGNSTTFMRDTNDLTVLRS